MENWSDIPICCNRNRAYLVCVTLDCNRLSPYQCNNQQCNCHYQHENCQTMNWNSFFKLTTDYKSKLSTQMIQYIQRFQKIFCSLKEKIQKQINLFKRSYQKTLFGGSLQKIRFAVQQHKLSTLKSKDFRNFLSSLQKQTDIHFSKVNLKQAKQIDSKILQIFSRIEIIYKSKINVKNSVSQIVRPGSSLQKSIYSKQTQETICSHKRSASFLNSFPFSNKSQILLKKDQYIELFQNKISIEATKIKCKPAKIDIKYPKSINSQILQNSILINSFIERKVSKYKLLYRASQNDFSISKFYEETQKYYDKKTSHQTQKACLIILKTQYAKILGGYTHLQWTKPKKSYQFQDSQDETQNPQKQHKQIKFKQDPKGSTFLFSMDFKQKYRLITPAKAIYCGLKSIGFGQDLRIKQYANKNRQNSCNYPKHFLGIQGQINKKQKCLQMIGSRYSRKFKITQWQAFGVQFSLETN